MARATGSKEQAKLNLRMSEVLQAKIEKDARKRGLSMNAAIISRIESSFRREQQLKKAMESVLGGSRGFAIFQTLAGLAAQAETRMGAQWTDDYETFRVVTRVWDRILPFLGPPLPAELRQKMAEVAPDKWPPVEDPPEPVPGQDGYPGPLLGGPFDGPSPEEKWRQKSTQVAQEREERRRFWDKMKSLQEQFKLFEEIGDRIAEEAGPSLAKRHKD